MKSYLQVGSFKKIGDLMYCGTVMCKYDPFLIVLLCGLCLCCSVFFRQQFIPQSVYCVFSEAVVISHCKYFIPFLFNSLFCDRNSDYSVLFTV